MDFHILLFQNDFQKGQVVAEYLDLDLFFKVHAEKNLHSSIWICVCSTLLNRYDNTEKDLRTGIVFELLAADDF